MAEDDIYGNKSRYENFKSRLKEFIKKPAERSYHYVKGGYSKYYCKNPKNLHYFEKLFIHFEAKDLSFIRRMRVLHCIQFVSYSCEKDLFECTREDINKILAHMHSTYISPKSKETFIKDLKYIWKTLFPELDEKGRPDDTLVPYSVRHLSPKTDKSKQKMRQDKLTPDEVARILDYFGKDIRMQAYINLAIESLARPQELLYLRLGNIELYDNYAKIWLMEHGKEGTGLLQCIDSYPALLKWISQHPTKSNPQSFLFVNTGNTNTLKQLKPENINKMLRKACKDLEINKPVTCYSLKRNGVTIRRMRGESDMEIQHAARWTSTQQLKVYDLTNQEDAFKRELQKRGLIQGKTPATPTASLEPKKCIFCQTTAGANETSCPNCKRPLNRETIVQESRQTQQLQTQINQLSSQLATFKQQLLQGISKELLQTTPQQVT